MITSSDIPCNRCWVPPKRINRERKWNAFGGSIGKRYIGIFQCNSLEFLMDKSSSAVPGSSACGLILSYRKQHLLPDWRENYHRNRLILWWQTLQGSRAFRFIQPETLAPIRSKGMPSSFFQQVAAGAFLLLYHTWYILIFSWGVNIKDYTTSVLEISPAVKISNFNNEERILVKCDRRGSAHQIALKITACGVRGS